MTAIITFCYFISKNYNAKPVSPIINLQRFSDTLINNKYQIKYNTLFFKLYLIKKNVFLHHNVETKFYSLRHTT